MSYVNAKIWTDFFEGSDIFSWQTYLNIIFYSGLILSEEIIFGTGIKNPFYHYATLMVTTYISIRKLNQCDGFNDMLLSNILIRIFDALNEIL